LQESVLVVGATGDMGKAVVRRLVTSSYRVVAIARSAKTLDSLSADLGHPDNLVCCPADIGVDDSIDTIRSCIEGPVRAVVHGPGVPTAGGVSDVPCSALTEAVNIKVGGMVRLVRSADAHLVKHSRLIAIGGHYGFEPTAYAATAGVANAALANLMRQYSWAMGERGITAHLIAPGPADTSRLRRVAKAKAEREGSSVEAVLESLKSESAINAFTDIEHIAWAVSTLMDREADALAGSTLFMDAGRRRGTP